MQIPCKAKGFWREQCSVIPAKEAHSHSPSTRTLLVFTGQDMSSLNRHLKSEVVKKCSLSNDGKENLF